VLVRLVTFHGLTRTRSLQLLFFLLTHNFPQLRKTTAEEIVILLSLEGSQIFQQDQLTQFQKLLVMTEWTGDIKTIKEQWFLLFFIAYLECNFFFFFLTANRSLSCSRYQNQK
jgi:hypothetical protein